MPTTVVLNPHGGPIHWDIVFNNLKTAVYRGILFNSDGTQIRSWEHQRSDDNLPDSFPVPDNPTDLANCGLYWEATVGDPDGKGGAFTAIVMIFQDGKEVGRDTVDGVVPLGYGKIDPIGSYIMFTIG